LEMVSIDCLKPLYILHDDMASASPLAIPSNLMTRSGQWVRFPDYLGVQRSQQGVVWRTPRTSPPSSQGCLSSTHLQLINTQTEGRERSGS
jgi:hypothetical protein